MPNRRQAIFWTNADLIHWRIYAALGGSELICLYSSRLLQCLMIVPVSVKQPWRISVHREYKARTFSVFGMDCRSNFLVIFASSLQSIVARASGHLKSPTPGLSIEQLIHATNKEQQRKHQSSVTGGLPLYKGHVMRKAFPRYDETWFDWHRWVIISLEKCGMKLLFHSQTS